MLTTRRFFFLTSALSGALLFASQQTPSTPPSGSMASRDIGGKWHFVFETEGGPRIFDADFKVDGKAVTGTWAGKPEVKGTLQDGKLDLEFPTVSEEAGEGTLKISGQLAEALTGTWSFQSYSGTFKATRPKA